MFPYARDAFANVAERLKESSLAGFSGAGIFQPMKITDEEAWREQCRRQLERDVMTRINYGFCHVHKPVLDDAPFRAFATMADYRDWCEHNLPAYLGYHRATLC